MIEVHVAHNFLNKNFSKNCLFYWFDKVLWLMYYNHVSVSNVIQNAKMDSYISYFMPTQMLERFNLQLCIFENGHIFHKKNAFFFKILGHQTFEKKFPISMRNYIFQCSTSVHNLQKKGSTPQEVQFVPKNKKNVCADNRHI